MDEEMEDFIAGCFEPSEIDPDYEFDAARFFDFTRPESSSEAQDSERWFESARSYPPSPFVIKLNLRKGIPMEDASTSSKFEDGENKNFTSRNSDVGFNPEVSPSEENNKGPKYHNHLAQEILQAKMKSMVRSSKARGSTLMKPTASHLAKQNKARDVYSSQRLQKPLLKIDERSLQNHPGFENQATKRQKLEIGYLRKVAHLKHQNLLLHKIAKKVGSIDANSAHSRSKVTIPREPDLETAQRARRQRSKNNSESGERSKPNAHTFKARPLNRKILEAPSLPLLKKSMPQLPEFQVFHLKTMERAMQSSANVLNTHNSDYVIQSGTTDIKRPNSEDASKQEKCETLNKCKGHPLNRKVFSIKGDTDVNRNVNQEAMVPTELKFPTDKRLSQNPPIELFNKLSLKSEFETNKISQPKPHLSIKGSKENALSCVQLEFRRCVGKPNQCGSDKRIHEIGSQPNINRSLDIR